MSSTPTRYFTVILFKLIYGRLVRMAGFSVKGREWLANGMARGGWTVVLTPVARLQVSVAKVPVLTRIAG